MRVVVRMALICMNSSSSVLFCADYWGSNGRRESQGSLSSGTSLEMATSCSAGKIEVRFFWTDHHGNTDPSVW